MSLRDLFVFGVVFGGIPYALRNPFIGIMLWSWLSFMLPHRLTWGLAYNFPFAKVMALTVLLGLLNPKVPKRIPWMRESVLMVVLFVWMFITTLNAHYPSLAWPHLEKVGKILLMVFVVMMVVTDKKRLNMFVWLITLSIGFYGVKGGIFTLTTGGAHMVLGPPSTFIGTHGEIGMGLAMTLPLMRYLQLNFRNRELLPEWVFRYILKPQFDKWIHMGFTAAIGLTGVAILGTHSRGAMLAGGMTIAFFVLKGRNKIPVLLMLLIAIPLAVSFMPESWHERMGFLSADTQDASARGRLNAWWVGFNMANHEFFGGGFDAWLYPEFVMYAPNPNDVHDAHSIYFEMLGEHGWVGLILFLSLALSTWMTASWIARRAKKRQDTLWMKDLVNMIQVSMVGYATSGAFIGQAYFDVTYNLIAVVVLTKLLLLQEMAQAPVVQATREPRRQLSRNAQSWAAYGGGRRPPPGFGLGKPPRRF